MEGTWHFDSTTSAGGSSAENDLLDIFGCAPPAPPPTASSANSAGHMDTADAEFDPFAALLDLSSTDTVPQASQNPSDSQCLNSLLDSDLLDFDPFQPPTAMASKAEKADDNVQEEDWLLVDKEETTDADKEKTTLATADTKDEEVKEKDETKTEEEDAKKDEEEAKGEPTPPVITVDEVDGQKKGEVDSMMDVDGEMVQMRRKPAAANARESTSSMGSDSDKRISRNSSMEVDADIDFSAIQDTEQLDVEVPKHKTELRRHSSLAKRQRPSRRSIRYSIREGDDESFYVDSTEPRPPVDSSEDDKSSKEGSPVANDLAAGSNAEPAKKPPPGAGRRLLPSGLDLSKIKRRKESTSSPSDDDEAPPPPKDGPPKGPTSKSTPSPEEKDKSAAGEEAEVEEKPAAPRKPPPGVRPNLMMPGLQDLHKSKLFSQDRSSKEIAPEKKEEKEPAQPTPALRPALKPVTTPPEKKPEEVPPKPSLKPALKPISKEQKDSQNLSTAEKDSGADKPDSVTPSKLLGKKPVVPTKPAAANPEPAPAPVLPTLRKVGRQSSKEQSEGVREKSPALELPTLKKVGTPGREGSSERDKEDSDREKTPPAWLSEMRLKKSKVPPPSGEDKSSREKTPETPAWMKAAQERKARAGDAAQTKGQVTHAALAENQGKSEESTEEKLPPWLAEANLKKAPKPVPLKESKDPEENKPPVTPRRRPASMVGKPPEKEPSPPKTEGDAYKPSWLKNGGNKRSEERSGENSGSSTPTAGGDQSPWQQEFALRRKNRQSESPAKQEGGKESSPPVPDWKREVSLKKRPAVETKEIKNRFSSEPEWKKEAEEKRKRLMKSGILQQK